MHLRTSTRTVDIVIAGAGPAGLACAIASARLGLQVDVIDAMSRPSTKPAAKASCPTPSRPSPPSASISTRILSRFETHPLHGIRFLSEQATTEAAFPRGPGRGIRRTILHQLLLDRATASVSVFTGKTPSRASPSRPKASLVHTNRQTLHARYLVGADGHAPASPPGQVSPQDIVHSRRIGLRQHYTITP